MATYYISPYGNDSNNGSSGSPWATLYRACNTLYTPGDKIFVTPGTYYESYQSTLQPGISIEGAGPTYSVIVSTYNAGISNDHDASIVLTSSSGSAIDGNQSISGIKLNGDGLTGKRAIAVNFRNNVEIYNCEITDFDYAGICLNGTTTGYPNYTSSRYDSGNSVHNCTIENCSHDMDGYNYGHIYWTGQVDLLIYGNTSTQADITRSGDQLNGIWSKGLKIYNNTFTKPNGNGDNWNFFSEIFFTEGGMEIYGNTFNGLATLDIVDVRKGTYSFGCEIHNNNFLLPAQAAATPEGIQGINFEERGAVQDCYVYKNYFKNTNTGVQFDGLTSNDDKFLIGGNIRMERLYVYGNIFESVGNTTNNYSPGISIKPEGPEDNPIVWDQIYIDNNTIIGGTTYKMYAGVLIETGGSMSNIYVRNNIIQGAVTYPVYFSHNLTETIDDDTIHVLNNLYYDNDTDAIGYNGVSIPGIDESGNIVDNPDFVSSSDFHLSADSSPAYHAGLHVTQYTITSDYDGNTFNNPPSIGAYEFGSAAPDPIPVTSIEVTGASGATTISINDGTLQMSAAILPVDADDQTVTWSVILGTGDASISTGGLLTASSNGTVTVRATANDGSAVYGELEITISNQIPPIPPTAPPSNALYNQFALKPSNKYNYRDLYNWFAVSNAHGIAPAGWHVPTKAEFDTLLLYLDPSYTPNTSTVAGGYLKEIGAIYWDNADSADNSSGFSAKGSGSRDYGSGTFTGILGSVYYWGAETSGTVWFLSITSTYSSAALSGYSSASELMRYGYSVRLIKDDSTDPGTMTDYDGNVYDTVKIGDQVWMKSNLNVTHYNDGTLIPAITDNSAWIADTDGAKCYYNNSTFGLAPVNTHIPTKTELDTLVTYLGGNTVAGGKLKEAGYMHWNPPNTGADNSSGFTMFGSGGRDDTGAFSDIKEGGLIWTQTIFDALNAYLLAVIYNTAETASSYVAKKFGLSVRCLLDDPSSWHEGDTIVDIDGYIYATIKIGTQVWMASNLYVKHFTDGTLIPMGGADPRFFTDAEWAALTTEGMSLYGVNSVETLPPDDGGGGDGGGDTGGGGGGTVIFSNDSNEINFDEPLNVVFSIGDIREVSFGSNNKSYTLNFPLTPKIRKLLKFINQADVKSEPSARAYLYVRKTLIIAGKVIVLGYNDTVAKVIISADDWMDPLSNAKLSALNLSDSVHILTESAVEDSWSAAYPAFRYPMINFGGLMSGESGPTANWLATDFIPMISIVYLINKILARYTIVSTWLNSATIKDKFILAKELVNDDSFSAGKGLNVSVEDGSDNIETGSSSTNMMVTLEKDIEFLTVTLDEATAWSVDTYTVPAAGTYHFKASVTFVNTAEGNFSLDILDEQVTMEFRVNGTAIKSFISDPYSGTEIINGIAYHFDSGYFHCEAGDLITLYTMTRCYVHVNVGTESVSISVSPASNMVNSTNKYAAIGDSIDLSTLLPDMSQLDFLAKIRDIYNLRFFMDKPKGTIYIEPWDQFLTDEIVDITEFVDFEDKPAETISQYYKKKIDLIWKNDLDDEAFKEYLKLNAEVPGRKQIIMTSQFVEPGLDIREHSFSSVIMDYNQVIEDSTPVARIFSTVPVSPFITYDRKVGFNTRIVHWAGLTAGFTWYYETAAKTSYPKIEPLNWVDVYNDYWQKLFHYIDKGKLYTIKMKIRPGFLTQFLTKIADVEKEAFRPVWQIQFNGVKQNFFLQKIVSDGWMAEMELILR